MRGWAWWLVWIGGIAAVVAVGAIVAVALTRSSETDAEQTCALVARPATDVFGAGTRFETDEGDCVVDFDGRVIVVHVYGDPVPRRHYDESRRGVADTDRSVTDAPVEGGPAFFADRRRTLWVYDPRRRVEFALFTTNGGSDQLVDLANAVLARSP
jgi:hypothetical protein